MNPAARALLGLATVVGGFFAVKKYVNPKAAVVKGKDGSPLAQIMTLIHPDKGKVSIVVPVTNPNSLLPAPSPVIVTAKGTGYVVSDDVKGLQGQLNTLGFGPLTVDGMLGPLTKAALTKFQSSSGIAATGAFDDATKAKLSSAMVATSPASTVAAMPSVAQATVASAQSAAIPQTCKDVQHALNLLGASPPLTEDNNCGPMTTAATKAFQIAHGLTADGIAGPQTKTALAVALAAATSAASASMSGEGSSKIAADGLRSDFYAVHHGMRG
jgi:peptidoglycan hydrolase-like protein with peptidoglycan-binding domain